MKISEVKKLKPVDQFCYWIQERYQIALRRKAGKPKPWTDDEILQNFFFTHPYREMDKVTVWFRENIREPLRDDPAVIFATICFRWFNLPEPTGRILMNPKVNAHTNFKTLAALSKADRLGKSLLVDWDPSSALAVLDAVRRDKQKIFTGAFMINSPGGEPKLEAIIRRITNVWNAREELIAGFSHQGLDEVTMAGVHAALTTFDGMGGFMAYEVVCDLRYTKWLENAPDKMTWCNVGPGARRGLSRILGIDFPKGNNSTSPPAVPNEMREMQDLLMVVQRRLPKMPPFELREIEHSLCEYDKYMRALEGDGKLKRRYNGI